MDTVDFWIFFMVMAALGGWLSRMCGGGWPRLRWGLDQWLYAVPYAVVFLGHPAGIVAYLLAVLGKRTGHGQYLSFGYHPRQPEAQDERLDFIVRFFMGVDVPVGARPSYWRCAAGMAVTGLAVTLGAGILFALYVDPLKGVLLALSGLTKPLAYMFGYRLFDLGIMRKPSSLWGEILTGVFGWGVLAFMF